MIKRGDFVRGTGLLAAGSLFGSPLGVDAMPTIYNGQKAFEFKIPKNPAQPPKPFDSNHNYIMYGGGKPIVGLVVTIEIQEDLVAPDAMSMQLNCVGSKNCTWQQYVTGMSSLAKPNLLFGSSIENWPEPTYQIRMHKQVGLKVNFDKKGRPHGDLFNQHFPVGSFADLPGGRIPAGWKLKWELYNDIRIADGAVIGAQYTVVPKKGKSQTSGPQLIRSFNFEGTQVPITNDALAPIFAIEMSMVGTNGDQTMHIESGSGTITYEAATPLTPYGTLPAGLVRGDTTGEKSNIRYAELTAGPKTKIVQQFRAMNVL